MPFENLPPTLPLLNVSRYDTFLTFDLDPEILDKTSDEVATLGEQLEYIFGSKSRTSGDGIIAILERGKGICALQPILKEFHEKYPENNAMKKWVIDILNGIEKTLEKQGVPVRRVA